MCCASIVRRDVLDVALRINGASRWGNDMKFTAEEARSINLEARANVAGARGHAAMARRTYDAMATGSSLKPLIMRVRRSQRRHSKPPWMRKPQGVEWVRSPHCS